MKKVKKVFDNLIYFESLEQDPSFTLRPMFGCMAIYFRGLLVALLAADPGDKTFKSKKYKFDIWDGVLVPTSREHHHSLLQVWPTLVPHPVLGKWLFLPQQSEDFELTLIEIVRNIRKNNPLLGIVPKTKKKRVVKKKSRAT